MDEVQGKEKLDYPARARGDMKKKKKLCVYSLCGRAHMCVCVCLAGCVCAHVGKTCLWEM